MAIVIYARKSTESEDRQVQSLPDQIKVLTELARREGHIVAEIFVESKSAKAPGTRPEFQRMIGKIYSGEISGILTWAINRLSRNLVDGGTIGHLLQTGSLRFIRTPERTYRPEDNVLIMSIENGMATGYIQDLSRSVKRGMKSKAESGWFPGQAPIGYKNNLISHEIDPDPERFELVKKGWDLLLSRGYTLAEIHRELTSLGLKAVHKNPGKRAVGRTSIYNLFTRPFYAGVYFYNGQRFEGKHKAMVTWEQFQYAQTLISGTPDRRYQKHKHTYSGVLKCGVCGSSIVAETKRKFYKTTNREAIYIYYHCTGFKGCRKLSVSESKIADEASRISESVKFPSWFFTWANDALLHNAADDNATTALSADQIASKIDFLEKKSRRIRDMRINEEINGDEFKEMIEEVKDELISAKHNLEKVRSQKDRIDDYVREKLAVGEQARYFPDLAVEGKRGLLQAIGKDHYLTLEKVEISIHPILTKIAAFEPLKIGSERPKHGEKLPENSKWLALLNDIRMLAGLELAAQSELEGSAMKRNSELRKRTKISEEAYEL